MRSTALMAALLLTAGVAFAQPSPYAGEEGRPVKSLSAEETADLMAGRGMGLAKAAELNSYPGPMHALALADELGLAADQRKVIEASRAKMAGAARRLGADIVSEERALDDAFARADITPADLAARTDRLGSLGARLRAAHLLAHIETRAALDAGQVARYDRLRGYTAAAAGDAGHPHEHRGSAAPPSPAHGRH